MISVHYTIPAQLLKPGEDPTLDWTVSHRYSDFETLRSKLCELSTNVPALPGKSWFGSLSNDLVNTRKTGLTTWLGECVSRPWILEREEWKAFLQVERNVPPARRLEWNPLEIKQVKNTPVAGTSATYGVNDLVYIPSALVLLLGMEEQRLLTKLDNTLSGIRMPWEKDTVVPRPLPLGTIRIHKVDSGTGTWKTMCSVPITAGVVCLAFDAETRTIISGLDDGTVVIHRVDARWEELEPVKELKGNHEAKSRVTAIVLHNRRHLLLSAARDKCLAVYDLRKEMLLSSTVVGASVGAAAWVSALEVDEDADLAFLGTYSQHIHIYDLSNPALPKLLHTLEGHTGSVRCMQYRPAERYLFSGGYEGWAGIWSINSAPSATGASSRESVLRSRSVGWLKDGANEKVKAILFIPPSPGSAAAGAGGADAGGLVVIGQDAGYLCFFSVSTGALRYATKAHANTIVKLVFIEDASVLISAGLDGVVRFWAIPSAPTVAGESEVVEVGASAAAAASAAGARRKRSNDEGSSSSSSVPRSPAATASASSVASPSASASSSSTYTSAPFFGGPQQSTPVRKSTASSTAAPPPSVASAHSVLHKSSRADSQDGTTFALSSSLAESAANQMAANGGASFSGGGGGGGASFTPSTSTHTSFFQEDDGDLSHSQQASSLGAQHSALLFNDATSSAAAARNLFDSDDAPAAAPAPVPSAVAAAPSSSLTASLGRVSISEDAHAGHAATGGAVEIPHAEEEEEDIF